MPHKMLIWTIQSGFDKPNENKHPHTVEHPCEDAQFEGVFHRRWVNKEEIDEETVTR